MLRTERPNPSPRASRRRAHKFNKTTQRKSLHRKTWSFYEKRRLDFDPKVDNDSQITIRRTHVNIEWLDYVVDCRKGGSQQLAFDIVEGGIANDNVIDTVEDYENGVITAEQALGQLKYKSVNHQICILNQEIVDLFLHYQRSEELNLEEDI